MMIILVLVIILILVIIFKIGNYPYITLGKFRKGTDHCCTYLITLVISLRLFASIL